MPGVGGRYSSSMCLPPMKSKSSSAPSSAELYTPAMTCTSSTSKMAASASSHSHRGTAGGLTPVQASDDVVMVHQHVIDLLAEDSDVRHRSPVDSCNVLLHQAHVHDRGAVHRVPVDDRVVGRRGRNRGWRGALAAPAPSKVPYVSVTKNSLAQLRFPCGSWTLLGNQGPPPAGLCVQRGVHVGARLVVRCRGGRPRHFAVVCLRGVHVVMSAAALSVPGARSLTSSRQKCPARDRDSSCPTCSRR